MELHLAEIAKTVATDAHALLIVDGAGWHDSKDLRVPDNITLLKLPPYAPELNPMENVWQYLCANKLVITVFDTHDEILDKCSDVWNFIANDPERANSGLLPFLPESLGSNVSLLPFGPVLAGPARKPVVRHRGSRLHGKELSAVLATIRHVLSFFLRVPRSLPHFGQTIGSFAPSGPRHSQSCVISLCEKV